MFIIAKILNQLMQNKTMNYYIISNIDDEKFLVKANSEKESIDKLFGSFDDEYFNVRFEYMKSLFAKNKLNFIEYNIKFEEHDFDLHLEDIKKEYYDELLVVSKIDLNQEIMALPNW